MMKFLAGALLAALLPQASDAADPSNNPRRKCGLTLEIAEQPVEPLIKRGDPGTEGIKHGLEGGVVLKQDSSYHLFTTEIDGDPEWTKTRIAHWTSQNRRNWTRRSTVFDSSGDFTGKDQRASLWAMPLAYDESARRWNLFYVAYRSKPNDDAGWYINHDGRVFRAVSEAEGPEGVAGPYRDTGVVLEPGPQSQPWEGLQGSDSFHIYQVGNRWLAFYGSAQTQLVPKPNPAFAKWNVGLAEADAIGGPWKRRPQGNPIFTNAENPVVTRLSSGRYVAIFDALMAKPLFIGYADSPDGLRWSQPAYLELRQTNGFWAREVRTPLGLIKESDGSFSFFFTGYPRQDPQPDPGQKPEQGQELLFSSLGFLSVRVVEHP